MQSTVLGDVNASGDKNTMPVFECSDDDWFDDIIAETDDSPGEPRAFPDGPQHWRGILGPMKQAALLLVIVGLAVFGLGYPAISLMSGRLSISACSVLLTALALYSAIVFFASMVQCLCSDPGVTPFPTSTSDSSRLCSHCGRTRPKRSNHCFSCNHCVYQLDHHCVWLGCCIGLGTHGYFTRMLVAGVMGAVCSLSMNILTLLEWREGPQPVTATMSCLVDITGLLILSVTLEGPLLLLLRNETTIERIMRRHIARLTGTRGKRRVSPGLVRNARAIFGHRLLYSMLTPCTIRLDAINDKVDR